MVASVGIASQNTDMAEKDTTYRVSAGLYRDNRGVIGIVPPLEADVAAKLVARAPERVYEIIPNPNGTEIIAHGVNEAQVGVLAVYMQIWLRQEGHRVEPSSTVTPLEIGQTITEWAMEPFDDRPGWEINQ